MIDDINCFSRESNKFGIICVISFKACTKKAKTLKFYIEITYFFQLSFFSNQKARS